VRYTPAATIVHPIAGRLPDRHRIRLEEWSRLIYLRKWHGPLGLAWVRLGLVLRFSVLAARDVLHRTPVQRRAARLRLRATLRFRGGEYGPPRVPAS
jgi:hypothetical protein